MSIDAVMREFKACGLELVNGKTVNRLGKMASNGVFRTAAKAAAVAFVAGILPTFVIPSSILSVAGFGLGLAYFARSYDANDALKDTRSFSVPTVMKDLVGDLVAFVKASLNLKSA